MYGLLQLLVLLLRGREVHGAGAKRAAISLRVRRTYRKSVELVWLVLLGYDVKLCPQCCGGTLTSGVLIFLLAGGCGLLLWRCRVYA